MVLCACKKLPSLKLFFYHQLNTYSCATQAYILSVKSFVQFSSIESFSSCFLVLVLPPIKYPSFIMPITDQQLNKALKSQTEELAAKYSDFSDNLRKSTGDIITEASERQFKILVRQMGMIDSLTRTVTDVKSQVEKHEDKILDTQEILCHQNKPSIP